MRILSIETSCDETSMSLVDFTEKDSTKILIHSHFTASQAMLHAEYGGVFPAVAKREHVKSITPLLIALLDESKSSIDSAEWRPAPNWNKDKINEILNRDPELAEDLNRFLASATFPQIDAIAVTSGPGLEIALWVGITFAKALGYILDIPVIGVNHMMGHLVSSLIQDSSLRTEIDFANIPDNSLSLLISGGHTELININNGKYELLGETVDDAIGEAYDKVARLMGLLYPGGPRIAKLAKEAREKGITPVDLPRPMINSNDYNFSYSGLKTAVMYHLRKNKLETEEDNLAMALGFENAATEVIVKKVKNALIETGKTDLLLGGGVAANEYLNGELVRITSGLGVKTHSPIMALTGDNALMIALAGYIKIKENGLTDESGSIVAKGTLSVA